MGNAVEGTVITKCGCTTVAVVVLVTALGVRFVVSVVSEALLVSTVPALVPLFTLTTIVMLDDVAPAESTGIVQVTVPLLFAQLHPDPVALTNVVPDGIVSVTVRLAASFEPPLLMTAIVYVMFSVAIASEVGSWPMLRMSGS